MENQDRIVARKKGRRRLGRRKRRRGRE